MNALKSVSSPTVVDQIIEKTKCLSPQDHEYLRRLSANNNIFGFIYGYNIHALDELDSLIKQENLRSSHFDVQALGTQLINNYLTRAKELLNTVITHECNLMIEQGFIQGDQPLPTFIAELSNDPEFIAYFFQKYATLQEVFDTGLAHSLAFAKDLLFRLDADYEEIQTFFDLGGSRVKHINAYSGDVHNKGVTTTAIHFTGGATIYYKPRPLDNEVFVYACFEYLKQAGLSPSIGEIPLLNRQDYGWMKGITYGSAPTADDQRQFYYKQGINLAVFYALGASDLIAENCITDGKDPYYFDLECILQPQMTEGIENHLYEIGSEAFTFINQSVLRTNILPRYSFETEGFQGISTAALTLIEGQLPELVLRYENNRFLRKYERIDFETKNEHLPDYKGERKPSSAFLEEIVQGFHEGYSFIQNHKEALLDFLKEKSHKVRIRMLYRPTFVYGRLLNESFHPKYLNDARKRQELFERLYEAQSELRNNRSIIDDEIRQMQKLDIPMFHTLPQATHLESYNGLVKENVFAETGLESTLKRIAQFSEEDRSRQEKLIRLIYCIHEGTDAGNTTFEGLGYPVSEHKVAEQTEVDRLLQEAKAIEKEIDAKGLYKDGIPSYWGLSQSTTSTWVITSKRFGIFDGLDGLSLFYLNLYLSTGQRPYLDKGLYFVNSGIRQFKAATSYYQEERGFNKTSLFNYPLSTFYLAEYYLEAGVPVDALDKEALDRIKEWISSNYPTDEDYDLLSGGAGAIIYLLKQYDRTQDQELLSLAEGIAAHILQHAHEYKGGLCWRSKFDKGFTGFSHGSGGIAFALLKLADYTQNTTIAEGGRKALAYERALFNEEGGYWHYFRYVTSGLIDDYANHFWAYGSGGILLSRVLTMPYYQDELFAEEMRIALNNVLGKGPLLNHNYSAGLFGNLDTLAIYAKQKGDDQLFRKVQDYTARLVQHKPDGTCWRCAPVGKNDSFVVIDGFFTGIAGLGNTMLNLHSYDKTKKLFL